MAGAAAVTDSWPTRELILLSASRLFATRGYLGTSTREIAAEVGIRQPSMYSHFTSKQAIAEELLRRDLSAGIEALERCIALGGSPDEQLYRYLVWEVGHVRDALFDLRALYLGEILELPEFEEGRRLLAVYDELLVSIVRRGVTEGTFTDVDVAFAKQAIDAIVNEAIRGGVDVRHDPDQAASFVVRALLRAPSRLSAVRAAAHRNAL